MKQRQCEKCQQCCISIRCCGTEPHEPCPDLDNKRGCGIYDARPDECRAFRCHWLEGYGGALDRPDKSGAIIYTAINPMTNGVGVNVAECWSGALKKERNKKLVARIETTNAVCVQLFRRDGTGQIYSKNQRYISLLREQNNLDIPSKTHSVRIELTRTTEANNSES